MPTITVSESSVLGKVDKGLEILDKVVEIGTIAHCGEMLSGMTTAFDRTVAYLKERE